MLCVFFCFFFFFFWKYDIFSSISFSDIDWWGIFPSVPLMYKTSNVAYLCSDYCVIYATISYYVQWFLWLLCDICWSIDPCIAPLVIMWYPLIDTVVSRLICDIHWSFDPYGVPLDIMWYLLVHWSVQDPIGYYVVPIGALIPIVLHWLLCDIHWAIDPYSGQ